MSYYKYAVEVTPNDSTSFTVPSKQIIIGGTGTLKVQPLKSTANVYFANVAAGTKLDIAVTKIYAANTTATNIIILY